MKIFLQKISRHTIWILISLFAVSYSILGVVRHNHFQSFGYDLGLYDQALWLYSQFQLPFSTIKVPPLLILGDHFAPSFALLSPIYYFIPDVRILIIAQATLVSLSAYPIFALAQKVLKNAPISLLISLSYLTFYGVQNALMFDVHMITLGAAFLPWLFYFLDVKKLRSYWIFFLIALGFKEDMSIILFTIGLYALLQYRLVGLSVVSMIISLAWFLFVTRYAIPVLSGSFLYGSEIPNSLSDIFSLFQPFAKWQTVFWSFLPFGFLPLFNLSALPMTVVHFLIHWLDPRFFGRWEMALHYRVPLSSMLAIGAIWGLARFPRKTWLPIGVIILSLIIFSQWRLHLPLNNLAKPQFYYQEKWHDATNKLISQIPKEATISTQNNFIPHLSHRQKIFLLWGEPRNFPIEKSPCQKPTCPWLKTDNADYILVSRRPGQSANDFWGYPQDQALAAIDLLLATKRYQLLNQKEGLFLYQKMEYD